MEPGQRNAAAGAVVRKQEQAPTTAAATGFAGASEFPATSDEGNILTMALMTALGQGKCALLDAYAMDKW